MGQFQLLKKPVITANFRPYEVAILHVTSEVKKDLKLIWRDTGYNTPNTYSYEDELISKLNLNIHFYMPKQTTAYRDIVLGLPQIDDPKHKILQSK